MGMRIMTGSIIYVKRINQLLEIGKEDCTAQAWWLGAGTAWDCHVSCFQSTMMQVVVLSESWAGRKGADGIS